MNCLVDLPRRINKIGDSPAIGLSTAIGCMLDLPGLPGAGNKIYDRSPYGNIGTITGAVWKRLPGGLWVLDFDGTDDYVDCGSDSSLKFTSEDFSTEFWAKFDSFASYPRIIGNDASETTGYWLDFRNTGKLRFITNQPPAERQETNINDGLTVIDTWYHFVASRDGATVTLYRNGVDATTSHGTHIDPATPGDTFIGRRFNVSYPMDGQIALVRIYNRALSALEIQNHFNREKHLFGVW